MEHIIFLLTILLIVMIAIRHERKKFKKIFNLYDDPVPINALIKGRFFLNDFERVVHALPEIYSWKDIVLRMEDGNLVIYENEMPINNRRWHLVGWRECPYTEYDRRKVH